MVFPGSGFVALGNLSKISSMKDKISMTDQYIIHMDLRMGHPGLRGLPAWLYG